MPKTTQISVPDNEEPLKSVLSSSEIEALSSENINLAYYFANKFRNKIQGSSIEDIEGQAIAGLVKAANTYSPEKGKFSSYASVVIQNYLRHMNWKQSVKKSNEVASMDAPISDVDGGEDDLHSKIGGDEDTSDMPLSRKEAKDILQNEINQVEEPYRSMVKKWMSGESYRDMQKEFKLSFMMIRNHVSRELKDIKKRLKAKGILNLRDILPESCEDFDGKLIYECILLHVENFLALKNTGIEVNLTGV